MRKKEKKTDPAHFQDLIRLKQGSKSKVDAIPDMHKTMSYYEGQIVLVFVKKSENIFWLSLYAILYD